MLKHKMSFFLDRKQQRVTLDISANGATESRNFEIPNINETSTIRSLALQFSKNRITLHVDCKASTHHDIDMNLAKLYTQMDDPVIKLVSRVVLVLPSGIEDKWTISLTVPWAQVSPSLRRGHGALPAAGQLPEGQPSSWQSSHAAQQDHRAWWVIPAHPWLPTTHLYVHILCLVCSNLCREEQEARCARLVWANDRPGRSRGSQTPGGANGRGARWYSRSEWRLRR